MTTLKRLISSLLLSAFLIVPVAGASNTILPRLDPDNIFECDPKADDWNDYYGLFFQDEEFLQAIIQESAESGEGPNVEINDILACAIKTGRVQFWMIPYFISNILNFLIGISGLLSILMIMVGAYFYIAGGITDDKEKGKTIISYALGGLVLTILSWTIVNFILLIITS